MVNVPVQLEVHRVSASGRNVGEVGDDHTIDDYRIDLSELAIAVKLSHRYADHWADRALSA